MPASSSRGACKRGIDIDDGVERLQCFADQFARAAIAGFG